MTNAAVNDLYVQMVLLHLESWTSQWHLPVNESSTMSHNNSVWTVVHVGMKENRAAMIIYYRLSIPSGIELDQYSMHPPIMVMEKQFQFNKVLNPWPCPWDLNLVIDWHINNLSYHCWVIFNQPVDLQQAEFQEFLQPDSFLLP